MVDPERYRTLFVQEAREHLAELASGLERLDTFDGAIVDALFRAAHSFKGMAATLGYEQESSLAHALEGHLSDAREAQAVRPAVVRALLAATDRLSEAVDAIENGDPPPDLGDETERLRVLEVRAAPAVQAAAAPDLAPLVTAAAELSPQERRVVSLRIASDCIAPRARLLILTRTLSPGRIIAAAPPQETWKELAGGTQMVLVLATEEEPAALQRRVATVPDLEDVQVATELPPQAAPEAAPKERPEPEAARSSAEPSITTPRTIRLDLDHVDKLLDQASEMRIAHAQLERQLDTAFVGRRPYLLAEAMQRLAREVKAVHDVSLEMRTVSVRLVTDRLPRLVRDLAGQLEKEVRLEVEGADTQADRSILETLADPLVHLVKNALDHGLEAPDQRAAAGKPREGTLRIAFRRTAKGIQVTVQDDGRGIPRDAALAKAIAKGLVKADEAATVSDDEVFRLLSMPGFSTADRVTAVSGRGVGLDAVKASIERVGGSLRISSTKGEGTTVHLELPPTLAIMEALEVRVDGEPYYIPVDAIVTTVPVGSEDRARGYVEIVDPRRAADERAENEGAADEVKARLADLQQGDPSDASAALRPAGGPANPVPEERTPLPREEVRLLDLRAVLGLAPPRYAPVEEGRDEKVERLKLRLREAAGRGDAPDSDHRPHRAPPRAPLGVVVERQHERACLILEGVGTIREIVVKTFDIPGSRARYVAGATIQGDGQVGLILDVPSVLLSPRERPFAAAR